VVGFDVRATQGQPEVYAHTMDLSNGLHSWAVWFTNDHYVEGVEDRNLYVDWLEIEQEGSGNIFGRLPNWLTPCAPETTEVTQCAEQFVREFGLRAWRRPLSDNEVQRYALLAQVGMENGGSYADGLRLMLQGLLLSPHFLFRIEQDVVMDPPQARALNDYEIASRLSYFLWSTTPDEELFSLAERGLLSDPEILRGQVNRMLIHNKAAALAENFAGQWLSSRGLDEITPDAQLFPEFTAPLQEAMHA